MRAIARRLRQVETNLSATDCDTNAVRVVIDPNWYGNYDRLVAHGAEQSDSDGAIRELHEDDWYFHEANDDAAPAGRAVAAKHR